MWNIKKIIKKMVKIWSRPQHFDNDYRNIVWYAKAWVIGSNPIEGTKKEIYGK